MRRYILSVQPNRPDGRLLEEAFRGDNSNVEFLTVYSVESALEYLRDSDPERPLLVLLGARFPNMSALEFLSKVKSDSRLLGIPVLVLGSYLMPNEIESFFNAHASSVIEMPGQLGDIEKMAGLIKAYWLGIAGLDRIGWEKSQGIGK